MPAVDSNPPVVAAPPGAPTVDSAAKGDTAKPAASAAKPAVAKPAVAKDSAGFDRAIRPKFRINEKTGKVDTIRKP